MPDVVGELLIFAVTGAGLEVSGATFAGISIASAVGSAAILAATIGLQYALRPSAPGLPDARVRIFSASQPAQSADRSSMRSAAISSDSEHFE